MPVRGKYTCRQTFTQCRDAFLVNRCGRQGFKLITTSTAVTNNRNIATTRVHPLICMAVIKLLAMAIICSMANILFAVGTKDSLPSTSSGGNTSVRHRYTLTEFTRTKFNINNYYLSLLLARADAERTCAAHTEFGILPFPFLLHCHRL